MIRTGMSTSCVYPLPVDQAFRLAREADFEGIEVMITQDPVTQSADRLLEFSQRYGLPILSVHAPVLLFSQLVWGLNPTDKLVRSAELAKAVGASTVVVHPPFAWQVRYGRSFERTVRRLTAEYGLEFAVENMFPLTFGPVTLPGFALGSDPVRIDCDAITLDFSHAALAGRDSLELAMSMGSRLRHVHLGDGTGSMAEGYLFDEHRVPGRGSQPVAEVLERLALTGWHGSIIAEVHTGSGATDAERLAMLVETREFARRYLARGARARRSAARSDSA